MKLLTCLLVVALSLLASPVFNPTSATGQTSAARGQSERAVTFNGGRRKQRQEQSPGAVNLRPRVTAPQPGIPAVKVTVDRKRVPLGDEVTFTLTPASVVLSPRFIVTLFFGDRNQRRVSQTQIVYRYEATGTYTYSILVKLAAPPPPPVVQDVPRVSLSATPTRVVTNDQVTFTAQLSRSYPNIRYRFVFDDQNETGWQKQPVTTHSYKFANRYLAYVDIGSMSSGVVKPLGGSIRQPIEVISPPEPRVSVTLSARPIPVKEKRPVTFVARAGSSEPNIRYRFDFGDGSRAKPWQASPRTTHAYSTAGNYPARVEIRVTRSGSGVQTAGSNPLLVGVTARGDDEPGVSLTAVPQSVPAGLPVFFRATTPSANSNTRYRFNFGDGFSGEWKEKPEDTHIYSLAGSYPAFVEVGSATSEPIAALISSGRKPVRVVLIPTPRVSPTPGPSPSPIVTASPTASQSPPNQSTPNESPSPDASPSVPVATSPTPAPSASQGPGGQTSPTPTISPTPNQGRDDDNSEDWWKYLLLPVILYVAYQVAKALFAPRPTLAPRLDPGDSKMGSESGSLGINFQMELNQNVTDGQVAVNTDGGSLIKSERKSDG